MVLTHATVGLNVPNCVTVILHRTRAKIGHLLGSAPPSMCAMRESTCRLPHKIVETIIAHLTDNLSSLKVCSLTCRSWDTAVVPYIHHTLLLRWVLLQLLWTVLHSTKKLFS